MELFKIGTMKLRLRTLALATALLAAFPAAAQSIGPLQDTFESDRAALQAAIGDFEVARRSWDDVAAEIGELRARVVADPLSGFALPDAMRQAHAVAAELNTLDARMRQAARRLDESMRALRDAASARVVALDAATTASGAVAPEQRAELARMQQILDTLDDPSLRYVPVPLDAILGALDDSPEELRAAADELADHETRLARQLAEVQAGIERARARERLEERVSALAFEERFFDDGGFRRAAPTASTVSEPTSSDTDAIGRQGSENSLDDGLVSSADPSEPARGGAMESSDGANDPAMPESQAGAGGDAEASENDFSGPPSMPVLDVQPIPTDAPAGGRLVDTSTFSADPTLRGLDSSSSDTTSRRRSRSRAGDLEALQQSLLRDIETLRTQRVALEAQAQELERGGF